MPFARLSLLFGLAFGAACSAAPTPLPDLPPPEYEPVRRLDLNGAAKPTPGPEVVPLAPRAAPQPGSPPSPTPAAPK